MSPVGSAVRTIPWSVRAEDPARLARKGERAGRLTAATREAFAMFLGDNDCFVEILLVGRTPPASLARVIFASRSASPSAHSEGSTIRSGSMILTSGPSCRSFDRWRRTDRAPPLWYRCLPVSYACTSTRRTERDTWVSRGRWGAGAMRAAAGCHGARFPSTWYCRARACCRTSSRNSTRWQPLVES